MGQHVDQTNGRHTSELFGTFLPICDENQNYVHWELLATKCCLYLKSNIFLSFDIEGLHISASTMSDFPPSARTVWTPDVSFPER
jgi:hypothetical protein